MNDAPRDYTQTKALVLGMGKSGEAAAAALLRLGAEVSVSDAKPEGDAAERLKRLETAGARAVSWKRHGPNVRGFNLVVVSPGVAVDAFPVLAANRLGIEVIGELELAYRLTENPIIAVTGTNGKSTVVTLLGEIFTRAGVPNAVVGNIGRPMVEAVEGLDPDAVLIVEVSSFQLETVSEFRPRIGVLLNVTEDHLDRHRTMKAYQQLKGRLFKRQEPDDYAVINLDDELASEVMDMVPGTVVPYSIFKDTDRGVFIDNGRVWAVLPPTFLPIADGMVADFRLRGAHNLENILAATAVALLWGVPAAIAAQVIRDFKGLPHRVEFVASIQGVSYYDDSKATNPDAAKRAIEAFNEPVVLLAGGRNKGMDFGSLIPVMRERVKAVVVFGEAADDIAGTVAKAGISHKIKLIKAKTMREAVEAAGGLAAGGDAVLLSPGCASFDMYESYAARGDDFQAAVLALAETARKASS